MITSCFVEFKLQRSLFFLSPLRGTYCVFVNVTCGKNRRESLPLAIRLVKELVGF